jgi:hypothetical protein
MKTFALFALLLAACIDDESREGHDPAELADREPRIETDYPITAPNAVTTAATTVPATAPATAPISAPAPQARVAPAPGLRTADSVPTLFAAVTQQPQTVNAVQSGPWTVGVNTPVSLAPNTTVNATVSSLPPVAISSLPSVAVSSLPAGLAIEPGRQSYQATIHLDSQKLDTYLFVDQGKRVVLQRIQASCHGAAPTATVAIHLNFLNKNFNSMPDDTMASLFFPLSKITAWGGDRWIINTETLLYLDATTVFSTLELTTMATCDILLSGYYVNI